MNYINKKNIIAILTVLVIASCCSAETIIEKFKPTSVLTKVTEPNSSAVFTYSPEGYVACTVRRSNLGGTAAKYFLPLSHNYYMPDANAIANATDLWFGFDFKYDPASLGVAAGLIGIYNSTPGNTTLVPSQLNAIGIMPYDLDKFTLRTEINNSDGTAGLNETQTSAAVNTTDSFRCKIHVYMSGSDSLADVTVYSVNAQNQTTQISQDTGIVVSGGKRFWSGMNALGVRNIAGSDNTSKSVFYVDNIYFSTTGPVPDANLSAPGWLAPDDVNTLTVDNYNYSQDFRPDPNGEWIKIAQLQSGSGMLYDEPNGSYYFAFRRKNVADSVAAFYKPLGSKWYEPFNFNNFKFWTTQEFWYGFDYRFDSGSTGALMSIGLFNSEGTNLTGQNCLGLEFHSGTTVALRVIGNNTWASYFQYEPTIATYSDQFASYRFKVRVYADTVTDKTLVDVECTKFNPDGTLSATPEFNVTGTVAVDGTLTTPQKFLNGLDALGVRNNSGSNAGPTRFHVDNMWISTEAPISMGPPSWLVDDCINEADFNCDGTVDMLDLNVIAANWLSDTNFDADLNESGRTDFVDYAIFSEFWGL